MWLNEKLIVLIITMLLTEKFHSICCLQIHPILFSVPNDMTPIFCLGLCACFPWEGAYFYLRNNFYCGEMPGVSTCCCPVYRTLGDSPSPLRETTQSPALEAVPAYCQKSGSLPTHPSCSHVRGAPFPSTRLLIFLFSGAQFVRHLHSFGRANQYSLPKGK